MPHGLTRRDFLRYSAATAGSLWLLSLAEWRPHAAQAAAPPQVVNPAPAFEALPLPALLGPPADVGIGTDGVYWVIDAAGAPSTYDPLGQAWQPFGGGIDAAAYIPFVDSSENFSVSLCFFRGSEVYKSGDPGPVPIAQLWPNLPPSFQQGVDGAAYMSGNTFYLFRQGQSANVDVWGQVTVAPLTAFGGAGWPGGPWQDGRFDYVISSRDDTPASSVIFVRSGQYIVVSLYQALVTGAPQPLSNLFGGAALALLEAGPIETVIWSGPVQTADVPLQACSGPLACTLQSSQSAIPAQVSYLPQAFSGWPIVWHPLLTQAPCGSSSALWSVSSAGVPLVNDTTGWTPLPLPDGATALTVDSGSDGSVYAVSTSTFYQMGAGGWTAIPAAGLTLQTVSVGDAAHIWLLDSSGNVYFYGGSGDSFTPVTLGAAAGDIKGSADGTLWHCNAGDANAYRYISEGTLPSEAIPVGLGVTSVQKATASSFGAAFFLAQQGSGPALMRYTSPYLFKTNASYTTGFMQRIPVGAASVFVPHISADDTQITVSALDVQTGDERWSYQYAVDLPAGQNFIEQQGAAPLYDPQHQLLYVFQYYGLVVALDAHSGAVRWSLQLTDKVFPVLPLLAGGVLYIPAADDPSIVLNSTTAYLAAIDTTAAAKAAAAGEAVQTLWVFSTVVADQAPLGLVSPVVYGGSVYLAAWTNTGGLLNLSVFQIDPATGAAVPIADITLNQVPVITPPAVPPIVTDIWMGYDPPELLPALVVNAGTAIVALPIVFSDYLAIYAPQAMAVTPSYTNLVLFGGVIYFADSAGNLYGLDSSFQQVGNLPMPLVGANIYAPLSAIPDEQGNAVIILGDTAHDQLVLYSTASGNILTLETSQTAWMSMSDVTNDGLLFGGGQGPDWMLGQFFGVRVNDLNALRDFVIESQMMQDYDSGATAVARYQTHITIVDNNKTPQPFTGVKIWCDDPISVLVDEQPFNIGPDTPVSTHVDAGGCLAISSDAADIFASPLRVWAAFMDPFERIVVYPDREFHIRLPAMVADPSNDDPTVINLSTGANYAGTVVFPDQQQAQDTAQAVTSVCSAAGLGTGGGSTASASRTAATQAGTIPYVAYDDLPGMQYFPYNTPAVRPPSGQNPYGLSLDVSSGYTVQAFAAAAAAIDALTGEPDAGLLGNVGSWFHSLWDKIKKGVAKVSKIVVSVAKAVYMGIQYVVDGVTHVLRHIVSDVEDLASLVGAFFVALGKAIEDVIELLSLLLHFEQVVKTHTILKNAIMQQIGGLAGTITNTVVPAVNTFFAKSESDIQGAFCTVKQQIVPGYTCGSPAPGSSPPFSGLTGSDATAHTAFSVAPKIGGSARSHAVLATWGLHKVRTHYRQATAGSAAAPAGNPILAFINGFANRLTSDPHLQAAYAQTLDDFKATFTATSATQFLEMALFDLLDGIADMLISSMAITSALLDGLLALASDLVSFLFDSSSGLLMQPLNIPILSTLYEALFGSQLTFFDLVLLAASIPVTFLYRIIEGAWFADQALSSAQATLTPMARAVGLINGTLFFGRSILMPINDTTGEPGAPNPILAYTLQSISGIFAITTFLKVTQASDLLFVATSLGLIFPAYFLQAGPAVSAFLALTRIGGFIADMAENPSADAFLVMSGNLLGSVPPLAQPLKYLNNVSEDISLAVLIGLEMIGNMGAGAVAIIQTAATWDSSPTAEPPVPEPNGPSRLYIPYAAAG